MRTYYVRQKLLAHEPSNAERVQVKLFSEGGTMRVHNLTGWAMMPSNPFYYQVTTQDFSLI